MCWFRKDKRVYLMLNDREKRLLLRALVGFRNGNMEYGESVDEIIEKVSKAKAASW